MTRPSRRVLRGDGAATAGIAMGGLGTMTVAALLVPWRESIGQTNVALLLVVVVVAAASIGGHTAGLVASLVAALSFNFWHTQPYDTLRIADSQDIERVVLLFIVGVIVGELTLVRERLREDVRERQQLIEGLVRLTELVAEGAPRGAVWDEVRTALCQGLSAEDVRFEPFGTEAPPLPRITVASPVPRRSIQRFRDRGFELPPEGAEVVVQYGGDVLGRLVIVPVRAVGVRILERQVAVAIADLFAASIAAPRGRDFA
jgi:hypothetical protein